jgi:2',3'-cyclic-nucleotide 2'-phosphodiesterase (5'-nucleotidase family)
MAGFAQRFGAVPRVLVGLLILFLGPLSLSSAKETSQIDITILHSNNLTGHLFPCPT